jgi:hypothetical protein
MCAFPEGYILQRPSSDLQSRKVNSDIRGVVGQVSQSAPLRFRASSLPSLEGDIQTSIELVASPRKRASEFYKGSTDLNTADEELTVDLDSIIKGQVKLKWANWMCGRLNIITLLKNRFAATNLQLDLDLLLVCWQYQATA